MPLSKVSRTTLTPDELVVRSPVWSALSELFLDTNLDSSDISRIATALAESPYSLEELDRLMSGLEESRQFCRTNAIVASSTDAVLVNFRSSSMNRAHLKTKRELIRKTYRELEQPATVVELCDRYLKLDPVDGIVWAWFGHSLMELGKFDEARAALQTARGLVQADDQLAFVIRCGGDLERSQGKYDAAETLYKEAIDLAPAHDAMWLAFGRLVFDLGRLEEAEDTFRKAASLKGSFSGTALYELGRVLRARGEFFEARRFLKAATKLIPHDERPRSVLADIESVLRVRSQSPDR